MTWNDALEVCGSAGGTLAAIESQEEADFVMEK